MELQEDAYRLHQVLCHVTYEELVAFLRTKVHSVNTEIRCRLALQYFLNLEKNNFKNDHNYEDELRADFLCIRHLLKAIPDDDIRNMLEVLGPIPNRKYVATKLLLHESNSTYRKRKKLKHHPEATCEASRSKLVKIADSTDSISTADDERHEQSLVPKLVLRRDRYANEFMVTPRINLANHPTTSLDIGVEPVKPITDGDLIIDAGQKLFSEECEDYYAPGPSRLFDNEKPRHSRISPRREALANQNLDESEGIVSKPPASESYANTVIDLNKSLEVIQGEPTEIIVDKTMAESSDKTNNNNLSDLHIPQMNLVAPTIHCSSVGDSEVVLPADEKLVLKIMEMFPDASPNYIRKISIGKTWSEQNFELIVDAILSTENYPRRPERIHSPEKEVDPDEQFGMLKELLPDADPTFLQDKVHQFIGDQDGLSRFIEDAVQNKNYPTMKEYLRQQQLSAQQRQYTDEFNVERFIELFPDPVAVFEDPIRKTTIIDDSDRSYVKSIMRNKYSQLYAKDVHRIVDTYSGVNIVSIVKELDKCLSKGCIKKCRTSTSFRPDSRNIPLLQELAYFEHKKKILEHLEAKKKVAAQERENAKELGLLQRCSCCFDDEVMPSDILTCTGGCRFCKECIRRSTEVAFGEGKINFPCFTDKCNAEFSLQVLQSTLPPKLFSVLAQKKAVAEVKAAGVEDLETCPFCDFANIPAPEDKLFRCLNLDCMKESCRLCKEPSHVPLRCDEVEKDEAVQARTYIENKMTQALVRECWKCKAKFIKEEGCNKMTCSCGARMCYICRQPVTDYKHFNGQGGDRFDLCPLYTDNFSVNEKNVLKAALEAKKEVDPAQLKNDPTADIQKHFGAKMKQAAEKAKADVMRRMMYRRHAQHHRRREAAVHHLPPLPHGPDNPDFHMHARPAYQVEHPQNWE